MHGAVEPLNKVYREGGIHLPPTVYAGDLKKGDPRLKQAIILAPPSAGGSTGCAASVTMPTPSPAAG